MELEKPKPYDIGDVNPCRNATGPCTYYLVGAPTGTVEVRVNDEGPLGWIVGLVGGGNPNNVMFGSNLIVSNYNLDPREVVVSHEIGHALQAQMLEKLGYNYLVSYVALWTNNHATHPMERDANRRAGLLLDFPDTGKPSGYQSPFNYQVRGRP